MVVLADDIPELVLPDAVPRLAVHAVELDLETVEVAGRHLGEHLGAEGVARGPHHGVGDLVVLPVDLPLRTF